MRKVTKNAVNAFKADNKFSGSNTNVLTYKAGTQMILHKNIIAEKYFKMPHDKISISLSGWNTVTTRERLNGILKAYNRQYAIAQRNYEPYIVWFDDKKQHKKPLDEYKFYTLAELDAMTGA
jgi:hypothetical protein